MSRRIWIAGVLLTGVAAGCATLDQLAPPVEQIVVRTDQADEQRLIRLRLGREIYVTGCARCHSPEAVTAYAPERWQVILPRMAEKAGLSAEERLVVTEYVTAVLAAAEHPTTTASPN